MIMTKELAILNAKEQFDEMIQQAATEGWMISQVEDYIWKQLLHVGHLTLQGYAVLQGSGDFGITFEYGGQRLNRLDGCYSCQYVSVFGEITISRTNLRQTPKTKTQARPAVCYCLLR